MSRSQSRQPARLIRVAQSDRPLAQAAFQVRRWLSRISVGDAAAILLVWGNIIGLLAYPAIAGHRPNAKVANHAPEAKQVASFR